jgi:hypothetical protein
VAWESTTTLVKDTEDRAALVEREAWERVSRVEAESAVALVSTREEVEGLVRKVTLLEGEHTKALRAREVAEENSCDLSDAVANAER